MDLTSLIQQTNGLHASILEAINRGSDKDVDVLSKSYEAHIKSLLAHEPKTLIELEEKLRFILTSLLNEYEDSAQAKSYMQIILANIERLKNT